MTCTSCGKPAHPEDRFCAACGAPLAVVSEELDQTGAITAIPGSGPPTGTGPAAALGTGIHRELPTGSALLVVHRGPSEGSEFLLPAEADVIGVGRSPESEVFLDDVTVSRRHAEFRRGADGWSVRDVGSLNENIIENHLFIICHTKSNVDLCFCSHLVVENATHECKIGIRTMDD